MTLYRIISSTVQYYLCTSYIIIFHTMSWYIHTHDCILSHHASDEYLATLHKLKSSSTADGDAAVMVNAHYLLSFLSFCPSPFARSSQFPPASLSTCMSNVIVGLGTGFKEWYP